MHIPEEGHEHLRDLLVGAVKVSGAVLGGQPEACAHLLGGAELQAVFQLLCQLLADAVRHLAHLHGEDGNDISQEGCLEELGQRLLVQRLAHGGGQDFLKLLLHLLPEGQDCVPLGLLGAELGAVFEHLDLGPGVVPQLIRLTLCVGDDGVRLLPGVGQDRGGLLICAVAAVLVDGRNKLLN